jgi:Holliday junction resolvasome RuvABC endonuclease subunit
VNALPKPESLFLGIDQSYSGFGLVVLDNNGHCHQKSLLKYPLNKFKDEGARLVKIYDDLIMHFSFHSLSEATIHIGMEGYAYGAKLNREKLGELGGIVKLTSNLVFGITPVSIAPTNLKSFLAGSGKASKKAMVSAVQKLDPEITDDNLADAYGIACYMLYSS